MKIRKFWLFSENYATERLKNLCDGALGLKRHHIPRKFLNYRENWVNPVFILLSAIVTVNLSGCSPYPIAQPLPFDVGENSINSPGGDMEPQMNGRYIVFSSDRRRRQNIYLYDVVEKRLIDLPGLNAPNAIASHPSVSQDGRYIAFATTRQGRSGIALYDRQTRQLRNLTANLSAEVRNPTISADGNTIAFESGIRGQWDILVYDRFGRRLNIPIDPR